MSAARDERGQAVVLLIAALCALLVGAWALGALARDVQARGGAQQAADLGALAAARAMRDLYPRLFEQGPSRVSRNGYLAAGRGAGDAVAAANGAGHVAVSFPHADPIAPVVVRVGVDSSVSIGREHTTVAALADAELAPQPPDPELAAGDDYRGPFAHRQGKPMRPDVARAFDRLSRAAAAGGVHLIIVSAFRSDAEHARLFAAHPDPKWVAPPGRSLHRLGTELDLGPSSAYGWLRAHGEAFHFVQRYAWEPWHWGYVLNPGSSRAMSRRRSGERAIPDFVPPQFVAPISAAAQRWNVSATLLAAQLYQESHFNPFAVSGAGARGIAQFMPGTAATYGLADPFDAPSAIDAQAHLMRDLLREFASVPLALAAYNAGAARVRACFCVPPIPETLAYVASILGLMDGAGDDQGGGLEVRLVR